MATKGVYRYGELGFDSGEGALNTATTSTEGSRRENYPILIQGGSKKMYYAPTQTFKYRNVLNIKI